jgi:hypothetical protein
MALQASYLDDAAREGTGHGSWGLPRSAGARTSLGSLHLRY